jgi:Uma2 family endonuclease
MATIEALITAEEFLDMPDDGRLTELVKGRIIEMTPPGRPHGLICLEVGGILRDFLISHKLGRAVGNDSAFITRRNPDSVRGPDVSFYRNDQIPEHPHDPRWKGVPPLVVEVLSPSDTWREILAKVSDYLEVGVTVACVVDPDNNTVQVFRADRHPEILSGDMELKLPDILGDEFAVPVSKFFV